MTAVALLLAACVPALALWLASRYAWARQLGAIVLCYAAGLLAGHSGLLPASTLTARTTLSEIAIALALPMILFTLDVRAWSRTAPRALWSMALATTAVVTVATALFFVLALPAAVPRAHELAALAVGVYTGGTPNLAAVKIALGVDDTRYLLFNAVDTAVSALYLVFILALGRAVFGRLLRRSPGATPQEVTAPATWSAPEDDYRPLLSARGARDAVASLLLAGALVGLAALAASLVGTGPAPALMISLVAAFGIVASFVPAVRGLTTAYQAGMYLIYVFSFTVASMANVGLLAGTDGMVPVFVAATVFASLLLHALLCRVARIDVDTFLVTSVSAICSPAFVPLVARSLGSRTMLLSGVTTGIIGYAIGTHLGTALGLLLARFD